MRAPQLIAAWLLTATRGWAADPTPPALESVQVTERLGSWVPGDLTFTDSTGSAFPLHRYFYKDKPVLLSLNYYRCSMLCSLILTGMVNALKRSGLALGDDFLAITVSIDPLEEPPLAAERKRGYLQALGTPAVEPGWSFLTGKEDQIRKLAEAVGFGYAYDQDTKQYAHPAVIFVLTPEGKISRYLYGIEYSPRDVKLALVEAAGGKVGTSLDRFILSCFKYDPSLRRYGFYVSGILKGGAMLVFGMLAALLVTLWRRELKRGTV
jgi:protein SCO1/2